MERTQDHVGPIQKELVKHQPVLLPFLLLACTSHHVPLQHQMLHLVSRVQEL